jgi:SAM-dependent methyltransferase
MSLEKCPACGGTMRRLRHDWLRCCAGCGFLASSLEAYAEERDATSAIDESLRLEALESLRQQNFTLILELLRATGGVGQGALLDVGCAHGWFVEAAAQAGFKTVGIEPDAAMHAIAARRCQDVRKGFFPDDLPEDAQFDVIVFNDVLEHLPRVDEMIAACHKHIRPGGRLLVNLPSSRGVLYRIANRLDICGVHGPFDRLWQRRFPSPHISYFNPDSLRALVGRHGFVEEARRAVPSVQLRGLWQRLRYDKTAGLLPSVVAYAALVPAVPVIAALPADTVAQVFRRREE